MNAIIKSKRKFYHVSFIFTNQKNLSVMKRFIIATIFMVAFSGMASASAPQTSTLRLGFHGRIFEMPVKAEPVDEMIPIGIARAWSDAKPASYYRLIYGYVDLSPMTKPEPIVDDLIFETSKNKLGTLCCEKDVK